MTSTSIWPFILLLALMIGAAFGGLVLAGVLIVFGALALISGLRGTTVEAEGDAIAWPSLGDSWRPVAFFAVIALPALLATSLGTSATLFAPATVLMLASLLNRQDTAASARSWALWIAWALWALCGALSMALLGDLGSAPPATVAIVAGLLGYNVARRAVLIQGRRPTLAHFAGVIVSALGATLLSQPADAPVHAFVLVVGLLLFNFTERLLPEGAPEASRTMQLANAAILVQHQLVCCAPVALLVVWIMGMM